MATRTITKTKTKVKTQDVEARTTTTSYGLDDAELRMDLDGSSSSQSDDDFGKDTLADIELHKQELAEIAANGGKKPRKKQKRTEGDVQTARTRKLVRNGQAREKKTSKWAIRERRLNPLIKLLDIDLVYLQSESSSSEGSIDTGAAEKLSDTSKAFWIRSRRRRKGSSKRYDSIRKSLAPASRADMSKHQREEPLPYSAAEKGKSRASLPAKDEHDSSATEDSDDASTSKISSANGRFALPNTTAAADDGGSSSEDISPMHDPAGYKAQLDKRRLRAAGGPKDPKQRANGHATNAKNQRPHPDSSDDEDVPVTHPKYAQRHSQNGGQQQPKGTLQTFKPYQQRDARPHFDIVTKAAHTCGPLYLGKDCTGRTIEIPRSINRFLREYQRDGVRFFWQHYARGEGGLLGDDMGLGKTIQVISFLCAIMGHKCLPTEENRRLEISKESLADVENATDLGPTALVIAPASVTENWKREIETWTYLSAEIYKPSGDRERRVLKDFRRGRLDVLIAGYETVRTHIDEIARLDFSCIFVDEAHRVKNPRSSTTAALMQLPCHIRFGLTGTAMQNRYAELHTVLNWCFPNKLGDPAQWKDYVETPLKDAQKRDATQQQLAIGRTRAHALVKCLLPNFFLRRTKDLIADQLPKKTDQIVFCPLSVDQIAAYKRLLSHPEVQMILTHDEPCPCGNRDQLGLPYRADKCCHQNWALPMLRWLSVFCKIANHAVLVYPNKADRVNDPPKFAQDMEITRLAFPDSYKDRDHVRFASSFGDTDTSLCGKWPVLRDLLAVWKAKGDKVLLFSRSVRLLDAIQHWLDTVPYETVRLDGSVPAEKRLALCDEFNDPRGNKFIFIISTAAGGVGLNLTAANRVVIFDPNWNPVADLQAMDRSYRWGQTRDVFVYRLVGAGSLEELIYTRQIYKQHQAEIAYNAAAPSRMFIGVQDDKRNTGELFGVKNLFRFNESANRTKHSIEEAQISELSYALLNHTIQGEGRGKKLKDEDEDDLADVSQTEEGVADNGAALDAMMKGIKPSAAGEGEDEIARILRNNGITYTHKHTDLVQHSALEERISKAAVKDYRNARTKGLAANDRASHVKMQMSSTWAPSKGTKSAAVEADTNPFEMLFDGGAVRAEDLADLADALDYPSAAAMARSFATMTEAQQTALMAKAKDIVDRI